MTDPKPRLLYICHRIPFPPDKGDKIRTFHQITYLCRKWQIDLVTFADDPGDVRFAADLEKLCEKVFVFPVNALKAKIKGILGFVAGKSITQGYFYDAAARHRVLALLNEKPYQAVFCFSSSMAPYVLYNLPAIRKKKPAPRLVIDFCDVDSDKWRQYAKTARFPMSKIFLAESRRLLAYEKKINQSFDVSIFVSENEAALFKGQVPGARHVTPVPNGVDADYFCGDTQWFEPGSDPTLVFTGAMDYYANIDGVIWFYKKILPQIKKVFPQVRFLIVGSNPSPEIRALSKTAGVVVTGYVADIREYYKKATVCVVPLRIARGIQNKVLEAMAMGRPVVATSAAFCGINARTGTHVLVADTETEFAGAVVTLLKNRLYALALGRSAREMIKTRYAWQTSLEKLDHLLS
ncbi:MAG: TIGR03087 family PEP-CTERM/XrtA system glycosyltransferase [Desulfotignum sp.]|nr:TIGR03087 family PEP-CTERM/XrtA system glycosyltransferase [Desulfotignum sp.]